VYNAFRDNAYPDWIFENPEKPIKKPSTTPGQGRDRIITITIPDVQGFSKRLQKIYTTHGVSTIHKPFNTIRNILVKPKDKTPDARKCGVVYQISCGGCDSLYVGETARPLQTRLNEHHKLRGDQNSVTGVGEHCLATGHTFIDKDTKILGREENIWRSKIREPIEIYNINPNLNRDHGYELPAIYTQVLSRDTK
jgi:hypothetical protein